MDAMTRCQQAIRDAGANPDCLARTHTFSEVLCKTGIFDTPSSMSTTTFTLLKPVKCVGFLLLAAEGVAEFVLRLGLGLALGPFAYIAYRNDQAPSLVTAYHFQLSPIYTESQVYEAALAIVSNFFRAFVQFAEQKTK